MPPIQISATRQRRCYIDPCRFQATRKSAALTLQACADLLCVAKRTVINWEKGRSRIPYSAFKLVRIMRHYELPEPWDGWRIYRGELWSPADQVFSLSGMGYLALVFQTARAYKTLARQVASRPSPVANESGQGNTSCPKK